MAPNAHRRRGAGTRVSTRLVALVLIPVLGLAGFGGWDALAGWRSARDARAVASGVQRAAALMPIGHLVAEEAYYRGSLARGIELGVDAATVSALLGFDAEHSVDETTAELDRRVDALPTGDPAKSIRADLDRARGELAADPLAEGTDGAVGPDLWEIAGFVNDLASDALQEVELAASGISASSPARRSLAALGAANAALTTSFEQVGLLGAIVWPGEGRDIALRSLGAAAVQLAALKEEVAQHATGLVGSAIDAIESDADVDAGEAHLLALSTGAAAVPGSRDPVALAELFTDGLERLHHYYELLLVAADAATADAVALGERAANSARAVLAGTLAAIVSTIVAMLLVARSFGRPLIELATAAEEVRAGTLDGVRLPTGGPREVREVAAVFGEVIGNLHILESQLAALESGDLGADALGAPLPGRLGSALHGSVERLSHSILERSRLADQLHHEATHDALTGLPNRIAATAELRRALARGRRNASAVAAFYVDLDGFKQVNDGHGHDAGDEVLGAAGERLLATVREGDFVARIGGDEFLVLTERATDAKALVELGERIVEALSDAVVVGSATTRVGASVGVAIAHDGDIDATALLRDADLACSMAKAAGRGRVELFDDALRASVAHGAEIERALRDALGSGELELHYQPILHAPSGAILSAEALVRWDRPGHGMVMPAAFIPIAESSDLIIDLGRWVLEDACRQLGAWRGDPVLDGMSVSVNLSGRHMLSTSVVDDIAGALRRHGVDPSRLVVEITETVLLTDLPLIGEHLHALRAMGVSVAIDDFGTGYTSIAHLRSMPVDILKIDRSLVIATESAADLQVLQLVVGTAHTLGMGIVAEGIETAAQLDRMHRLGCDHIQGFLVARPTSVEHLAAVVGSASTAGVALAG